MTQDTIHQTMKNYIANHEMAGGALIVRKNDQLVFDQTWGWADISKKKLITDETIFRIASMTKVVTSVAVMKLIENGKMSLDDPVSKYVPEFERMCVVKDSRYDWTPQTSKLSLLFKFLFFNPDHVHSTAADREITIRDLLSHASGLQQGVVGMLSMMKLRKNASLEERVQGYTKQLLDFQPGTATSYSPLAAFDILGYIIGKIMHKNTEEAYRDLVFDPLKMKSSSFFLKDEENLARTYTRIKNKLVDTTDTSKDLEGIMRARKHAPYMAGSAGLYCTVKDYEKLVRMLCNEGDGYLQPKSIQLMATEAQAKHLEPFPGTVWGLGVLIRQNDSFCTPGTYGWSGAIGTHFFVSPKDKLEAVFATHRTDLGGSASYISRKVEEMVFEIWGNRTE